MNPGARISVKLVAEVGVGTVAAGVAKAHSDHILISGHDGGTGASPVSSIHYAGSPWEIGLSETHQTLVANGLRDRVTLATDGKLLTGRDVVIGALLGAEEFGFATSGLILLGCVMMRKCHLNTCPVGVATQDEELRKKFVGRADYVVNYLTFVAEEVREIMAQLGYRSFNEMVGQVQRLKAGKSNRNWKSRGVDFTKMLAKEEPAMGTGLYKTREQDHGLEKQLDNELVALSEKSLHQGEKTVIRKSVKNTDRSVGTMLSGYVARAYGENGLPDQTIQVHLEGTAGQSFGAFLAKGITLNLVGEANDYVGKGLSGGKMIIRVPEMATFDPTRNIIIGNTCLYGATSGEAYFNGVAGERFAVRNSGAYSVVEGVGDHGCEYMTGGRVVVLGKTGRNFAAGMSGGIAYVWDPDRKLPQNTNMEMVSLEPLMEAADVDEVLHLITRHFEYTGSLRAEQILKNWEQERERFVKIIPGDYKLAMQKLQEEKSMDVDEDVEVEVGFRRKSGED